MTLVHITKYNALDPMRNKVLTLPPLLTTKKLYKIYHNRAVIPEERKTYNSP